MDRLSLTAFWRSLTRHRLYAALNIGGLAIGIAVFLVLALYVRFEASFERWLPRHGGIYLVETNWRGIDSPMTGTFQTTMGGLLEELKADFPGLVGTRVNGGKDGGSVLRNGLAAVEDVARVDADFFKVFDLPMVAGDKATALADPASIVVSQSAARRYFGNADPIGRTLTVAFEKPAAYRVTGVFADLPDNTDFRYQIVARQGRDNSPWWNRWGSSSVATYLRFADPARARAFTARMHDFVARHGARDMGPRVADTLSLSLLPMADVHFQPEGKASAARKLTVVALGIVGVMTLLIAGVNYVNLATARAGLRAREVAMRKVLGADRLTLMRQYLGEAVLTVGLAALLGLALAELSLPLINAAGGLSLAIPYAQALPFLAALSVAVGLLAGAYPALLLSRWPASQVLQSARTPGGGRSGTRIREGLVVVQFSLAVAMMAATAVLVAQARHVRATDLGFRREGLLVLVGLSDDSLSQGQRVAILGALGRVPGVTGVTTANTAVGYEGSNNFTNVDVPGRPKPGPTLRQIEVGPDFFRTYGARLVAGRLFDDRHPGDDSTARKKADARTIVLNRLGAAKLGFASPQAAVGKTVGGESPRTIIGVVDQLRFYSPRLADDPTYYTYYRDAVAYPVLTLRYQGDARAMTMAVRDVWRRMAPQLPFTANTGVQALNDYYKDDDQAARLFGTGAGLAVLIGCVGLWGLASFNTARRMAEIGIRKTLGATSADVARLLVGQFLRPVLLANLLAWPLAFVAMRTWLAGFDDRIALSPLFFVGASLVAVAVAVATVLGQSIRASRATPAWALRHE